MRQALKSDAAKAVLDRMLRVAEDGRNNMAAIIRGHDGPNGVLAFMQNVEAAVEMERLYQHQLSVAYSTAWAIEVAAMQLSASVAAMALGEE